MKLQIRASGLSMLLGNSDVGASTYTNANLLNFVPDDDFTYDLSKYTRPNILKFVLLEPMIIEVINTGLKCVSKRFSMILPN